MKPPSSRKVQSTAKQIFEVAAGGYRGAGGVLNCRWATLNNTNKAAHLAIAKWHLEQMEGAKTK